LNFLALALTPERGFTGAVFGAWAGALFSEGVAILLLVRGDSALLRAAPGRGVLGLHLPEAAVLAFTLAAALLLARFVARPRAADAGLLWSLLACVPALHAGGRGTVATLYFAVSATTLVIAVIESSYFLAYHDELTGLPSRRAF